MNEDEIPDSLSIHSMPVDLATLKNCLLTLQRSVRQDISDENYEKMMDLTTPVMSMIQDAVGNEWPPVCFALFASALATLLDRFAQEIQLDENEN